MVNPANPANPAASGVAPALLVAPLPIPLPISIPIPTPGTLPNLPEGSGSLPDTSYVPHTAAPAQPAASAAAPERLITAEAR